MAESEEEPKSLLMKVKEVSEIAGLKLNTQKIKIMTSGPITSWQIDGETAETVADFIFWGSKITADGDCSHKIKRHLLLGRKVMTNLDSIFKSRDITLKTQQWPQDWKRSVFIPIPKKGNAKECSNYCTIALISHNSKVMLKILQARLQQYVN